MAQFDVYVNPSKTSKKYFPYVIDIQSNFISDIDTRIVIPIARTKFFNNEVMKRLTISIEYENEDLFLMTPQISSMNRSLLKKPIGSLSHLHQEILDSLDFAISGI
tara:strand:- start:28695 stop:29012 length:318 start_codon:yes stop_codon:yes gene_type:complete